MRFQRDLMHSHVSRPTSMLWIALAISCGLKPADAQYLTRPQIPWRTITTSRFDVHFPAEMERWTRLVASQMESVANAVNAVVGNTPESLQPFEERRPRQVSHVTTKKRARTVELCVRR